MKTSDPNGTGMCPYCNASECIGLTNGNGSCTMCGAEFLLPVATDDDAIELYARMATEWRARALNTQRSHGHAAARFDHGIANLWTNMLPKDRQERVEQGSLLTGSPGATP